MSRFDTAIAGIDAVHAEDPERDAAGRPKELAYAQRMSAWLEKFAPQAPEPLKLAVRCQHLRRWAILRGSFPEGLAALFAYEYQVPEVAASKIDGLVKHYGISDGRSLEFFRVHLKADVYHSRACAKMLDELSPADQEKARTAALEAATALWTFLDGMEKERLAAA